MREDFNGLSAAFNKYADKEIYILYSPKCGRIFLLDTKKEEKIREELREEILPYKLRKKGELIYMRRQN